MGRAKEIIVKIIPSKIANNFVKKHHYSGKVVPNSKIHFGCFLDNQLHGVMSYGASINKKGTINLVKNTGWNEFIELNRMAFDDYLPKNSESRCISISIKMIKKNAPHIKWIISFADGTQCGDGTIYRASGFKLVEVRKNAGICKLNGQVSHIKKTYDLGLTSSFLKKSDIPKLKQKGYDVEILDGFQLKYIFLIDKTCEINAEILPFSYIKEVGAKMYKGLKNG
ncbi:hypothetical protein [uncultured Polaribacter sp.]|uniref:Mom family adenine methylcarbamoylation protein n=1 Tax=uncultured Polaribacter sp. TaxID=174711 RepID=UPI00259BA700|nr:hypothetical protein [uncultured Polaribacter sp.]